MLAWTGGVRMLKINQLIQGSLIILNFRGAAETLKDQLSFSKSAVFIVFSKAVEKSG